MLATFQIGDGEAEAVGILEEKAAGNLAEDAGVVGGPDDDEAQVLLRFETIEGVVAEAGSGDGFDEEVGHFLGGIAVHFAIQADDGAEGGDRVGDEGLAVGFEQVDAGGDAAGVGVLDDGDGGLFEFLDEIPAGVEIDEVVVAELLALELMGRGDAAA